MLHDNEMSGARPISSSPKSITTRADVMPADYRWCFGCGEDNPAGLQLAGIRRDGEVVSGLFVPDRKHQGFPGLLHGGVVASVLDEMMSYACVLITGFWSATLKSELRYRKPVPVDGHLRLESGLTSITKKRFSAWSHVLLADGSVAAEATALFVAVPEEMYGGFKPPHLEHRHSAD